MSKPPDDEILRSLRLADGREVIISRFRETDAAELIAYADATAGESPFLSYGRGEYGMTVEAQRAFLRSLEDGTKGLLLKATSDDRLIGLATLARSNRSRLRHAGELGLSVRKAFWRRGIGTALATTLLAEALRTGVTRAWLQVRADNERALRLCERLGFRHEGRRVGAMIVDGVEHDVLLLGARIVDTTPGPLPARPS